MSRCEFAFAALASLVTACEVVDVGPSAGIPERCRLSERYFLEQVLPSFLERHDCRGADAGACHDVRTGVGVFRLEDTSTAPAPSLDLPLSTWPRPYAANLEATARQMGDCTDVRKSPLYAKPADGATLRHEGGALFPDDDAGPEFQLLDGWLAGS